MFPPKRTKSAIAIRQGDKWTGVFNANPSTPLMFGWELWEILQDNWKTLSEFGKELLKYGYWEEYKSEGLCPYCGKFIEGTPCNVMGQLIVNEQEQIGNVAPDPNMQWHRHLPKANHVRSINAKDDGLWIEWVYVIDPKNYMLEIFKSVRTEGNHLVIRPGKKWHQDNYEYFSMGLFSLLGDEPDWQELEYRGMKVSAYYFDKYKSLQSTRITVL